MTSSSSIRHPAALFVALALATACAPAVRSKQVIATSAAPAPIGAYSQAIQAGATVYVAGQIALDPQSGQLIAGTSIEAQTRRALDNLRSILAAANLSLADVVATQIFLVDLAEAGRMNAVYAAYFPHKPPARFVVGVAELPRGARVEIAATAVGRQ